MKKLCLVALSITLAVVLACPALATSSEEEIAAEYLKEQGILEGDQNGDMNLASGLTRAQLAAVLTRLNGNQEHVQAEQEFYISQCKFPDVPAWARLYVGHCYFNSLMVGYDTGVFGADDGVTPAAACTVVLRYMDLPDIQWDYNTACQTALDQGLTTAEAVAKTEITRGDLAIMLRYGRTGGNNQQEHRWLHQFASRRLSICASGRRCDPLRRWYQLHHHRCKPVGQKYVCFRTSGRVA